MKTLAIPTRRLGVALLCFCAALAACPASQDSAKTSAKETRAETTENNEKASQAQVEPQSHWKAPEHYPSDPERAARVKYGEQLVAKTHAYLSPSVKDPALRVAGNHLACKNCHLENGKAAHAMGFIGIDRRYPAYYAPQKKKVTLSERIEACFQGSLNGKNLPAKEREALTDYLTWLGEAVPDTAPLPMPESGLPALKIDSTTGKGDANAGQPLYDYHCAACHGKTGLGLVADPKDLSKGYTFPPLWGPDSHSKRSSMADTMTAAKYIHQNMPLGRAVLTTPQSLDIAAYVNTQERPD
jgi:thiosulfate dehydrogenase